MLQYVNYYVNMYLCKSAVNEILYTGIASLEMDILQLFAAQMH
jgi:hypothetical protein